MEDAAGIEVRSKRAARYRSSGRTIVGGRMPVRARGAASYNGASYAPSVGVNSFSGGECCSCGVGPPGPPGPPGADGMPGKISQFSIAF